MNELFLLKLGEIILKGSNRRSFEDRLRGNIARRIRHCGEFKVYITQSTVYVEPQSEECDMDGRLGTPAEQSSASFPCAAAVVATKI